MLVNHFLILVWNADIGSSEVLADKKMALWTTQKTFLDKKPF